MPGEIEVPQYFLWYIFDAKSRQDAVQHSAMQYVELGKRDTTRTDLFHSGAVFCAPGIGKGKPIEHVAAQLEYGLGLARNFSPPIDQGAKDVEEQGLDAIS